MTNELYALRYATHRARRSGENFLGPDPHDDSPMPLDFYLWVIRAGRRTIVIDTGCAAATAARRQRDYLHAPGELLRRLDVDAATVEDVVITHMHYDHAGNLELFPRARFWVQEAELAYCTGRAMSHAALRHPVEPADVATMIHRLFDGRLSLVAGEATLAPGVSLHLVGGHTAGMQVVRVATARGHVVLASDAAHYWVNLRERRPFPIVADVARMLDAHHTIERLADGPDHIIPGHDPQVRRRFPAWRGDRDIVALHEPPLPA